MRLAGQVTVVRPCLVHLPEHVLPLTAADIEPTLSHVAWDGRTRPKPVVAVTTGCASGLFVVAGWGEAVRSVPRTGAAGGQRAGDGDGRVEPAEPAGPAGERERPGIRRDPGVGRH